MQTSPRLTLVRALQLDAPPEAARCPRLYELLAELIEPGWNVQLAALEGGVQLRYRIIARALDQGAGRPLDRQNFLGLVVRRILQFACDIKSTDPDMIVLMAEGEFLLPRAAHEPRSYLVSRGASTIMHFAAMARVLLGMPPTRLCKGRVESEDMVGELFDDAKSPYPAATRYAPLDALRPLTLHLLCEAKSPTTSKLDRRAMLLAAVSIYYGLDFRDAMQMMLGGPDSIVGPCPGAIDLRAGVALKSLGNGFWPRTPFSRSMLTLPMPLWLRDALAEAANGADQISLGELFGADCHLSLGEIIGDWCEEHLPRMNYRSLALHHTFDVAALLHARLRPTRLSMLRGQGVYGSGPSCAYAAATTEQLRDHWKATISVVEGWAGITSQLSEPAVDDIVHGTPVPSLRWIFDQLRERLQGAQSVNEVTEVVELVFRCLGKRAGAHANPAADFRQFPRPCLHIADKHKDGRSVGSRLLDASPGSALRELLDSVREIYGDAPLLPYRDGQRWLTRNDDPCLAGVSDNPTIAARNPYRTAWYQALEAQGASVAEVQALTGHGSRADTWSVSDPYPEARVFDGAARLADLTLRAAGLPALVCELRESAARWGMLDGRWARAAEIDSSALPHCLPPATYRSLQTRSDFTLAPEPNRAPDELTSVEAGLAARMMAALPQYEAKGTDRVASLMVLLAIEGAIPLSNVTSYAAYLTPRGFLHRTSTDRWYWAAPCACNRSGGLSAFPAKLPSTSAAIRLLRTLAKPRQMSKRLAKRPPKHDELARVIRKLAGIPSAARVSAADCVRLADRVTTRLAFWRHPASVAAALSGVIRAPLNHYRMDHVLRYFGKDSELKGWDGKAWDGRIYVNPDFPDTPATQAKPSSSPEREWLSEGCLKALREELGKARPSADHIARILRQAGMPWSWAACKRVLEGAGCPKARLNGTIRRTATWYRIKGYCSESAPHFLPTPKEMHAFADHLLTGLKDPLAVIAIRPKNPVRLGNKDQVKRSIGEEVIHGLVCLAMGGGRVGELYERVESEIFIGNGFVALYTKGGKSPSARRITFGEHILPLDSPAIEGQNTQFQLKGHFGKAAHARRLTYQLRRLLSPQASLHDLRHIFILQTTLREACDQQNGSPRHRLASRIRQHGHQSPVTSCNSYCGVALFVMSAGPDADFHSAGGEPRKFKGARLGYYLKGLYNGDLRARWLIAMELHRFLRQPPLHGAAHRLQFLAADEPLPHDAALVELPWAPHLVEYWVAVEACARRASENGSHLCFPTPDRGPRPEEIGRLRKIGCSPFGGRPCREALDSLAAGLVQYTRI